MLNSNQLLGFGGIFLGSGPTPVTWNPSDKSSNVTLSNGNLDAQRSSGTGFQGVRANVGHSSGLRYFELLTVTASAAQVVSGIGNASMTITGQATGNTASGAGLRRTNKLVTTWTHADTTLPGGTDANNDLWMFAVNLNNGKLWCGVNGVWTTGDPAADTTPWVTGITGTVYPATSLNSNTPLVRLIPDAASMTYKPTGFSAWNE